MTVSRDVFPSLLQGPIEELPDSGSRVGQIYIVTDEDSESAYMWMGSGWAQIAQMPEGISVSPYGRFAHLEVVGGSVNISGGNISISSGDRDATMRISSRSIGVGSPTVGYNDGEGAWIGIHGDTPKAFIGSPSGHNLKWTGSELDITGKITADEGDIGSWTITETELHNTDIWLDAADKQIAIGSQTWQSAGIQLEYNAGSPRMYVGDGSDRYFEFDGTNATISGSLLVHGQIEGAVLSYEAIQATSGTILVTKSAGRLLNSVTTVASPTTFDLDIEDPEYGHVQLFSASDVLRLRKTDGTENWVTVSSVTDNTTYYTYTCTLSEGSGTTFVEGTPVLNYGQSGAGLLYLSADDADAPFYSVRTWETDPWTAANVTERARLGNMRNLAGTGANDRFGFFVGDYANNNYMSFNAETAGEFIIKSGDGQVWIDPDGLGLDTQSTSVSGIHFVIGGVGGAEVATIRDVYLGATTGGTLSIVAENPSSAPHTLSLASDNDTDSKTTSIKLDSYYEHHLTGTPYPGDINFYVDSVQVATMDADGNAEFYGAIRSDGTGLMALSALPMSTGQVWIMPMAHSSTVVETIPWGENGTVNGTWRSSSLSSGVAYNSFDGSNDWLSWADGTKTTPRYSVTWIGWVQFDNAAGGSAEMIAAQFTAGDACWFVDRRNSTNSGTIYAGYYISSTKYTMETDNTYGAGSWYCVGFTYDYASDGGGLFVGKTDGTYEWKTNAQTGALDNSAADFTVGAADSGSLKMDGDVARPWALMSHTVDENWFVQYLEMTRGLFS